MCYTHTEIEDAYAAEIEEREEELSEWERDYAESEDYDNLTHAERMELEAAVDRYLDEREDREQDMLEAQWFKAEMEMEELPVTTVTAIIRNDSGQLLYVMGTDGEWELPWGPITSHGDHNHEVYTPHEMDSMMSLADMLLTTLGVKVESCQWVGTRFYKADDSDALGVLQHLRRSDDYEVVVDHYPEVQLTWPGLKVKYVPYP